jgi:WD40 repeat protein
MPTRKAKSENQVSIGDIREISGEVNIASGDITRNIKIIQQRALTAGEEAARARKQESKLLAQGIAALVQNLFNQISQGIQSENPYKGLLPYSLNEAEIFYGRDKARKDLLVHIKQSSLTVLHAESGAGKSSLLQAGIAAQLIANGHLAVYLRPYHADPVEFIKRMFLPELTQAPALARASLREFLRQVCAVLGPKVSLYLLLDQFEEFFQLKRDERQPFLEALADCLNDPSLNVRWVLALRKEALSDLAELESYGITQFKNTYRLDRLSRAEAQEAITKPAGRHGITFEPALIDHILDTLTSNDEVRPTHLQLVCSALTEDLPEEKTLTLAYYTEHEGGTEGILRDYLKRQLEDLPASEQILAWKVLRVLITADRHRAVKTYDEIVQELKTSGASKKQIETVLGRLVERRLLFTQTQPATEEMFELAHDYLIKEIELDPQEQALKAAQELLDQETRTYQRHKTLLTAERLAVIEPYRNELRFFADAEVLLNESRKAVQAEQHARERRRNLTVVISSAVAIAMTLLAIWGFRSSKEATEQAAAANTASTEAVAQRAMAQANAADAQRQAQIALARTATIASVNLRDTQLNIALLLGIEANKRLGNFETQSVLFDNLRFSPLLSQFLYEDDHAPAEDISDLPVLKAGENRWAFSPNGNLLAIAYIDGTIRVWDRPQQKFSALLDTTVYILFPNGALAFSRDGKKLAAGTDDGYLYIWDLDTKTLLTDPITSDFVYIDAITFSNDGNSLAFGGFSYNSYNAIYFYNPNSADRVAEIGRHPDMVTALAFNANDQVLASGSLDGTIWLTGLSEDPVLYPSLPDLTSAYPPNNLKLVGHNDRITSLEFGKDGRTLISTGTSGTKILWALDTKGSIEQSFANNSFSSAQLSPDGRLLLYRDFQNSFQLWDMITHQVVETIPLNHPNEIHQLPMAFTPDGNFLSYNQQTGTFTVWSLAARKEIGQPLDQHAMATTVAYSPDGTTLAVGDLNGMIELWNAKTHKQTGQLTGHTDTILRTIFSPDGKLLLSSGADQKIIVWDLLTKQQVHEPLESNGVMALSPDGKTLAFGDLSGVPILFDLVKYERIGEPLKKHEQVTNLSFNKDGSMLASSGYDSTTGRSEYGYETIILWDVTSRQPIGQPIHNFDETQGSHLLTGVFSADGKTLLAYDHSGNITLWDVNVQSWIERGCKIAGRNLTRAEWAFYFTDKPYPTKPEDATCPQWPLEPEATPTP